MDRPTPATSPVLMALIGVSMAANGCAGGSAPPPAAAEVAQQPDAGVDHVQQPPTEAEGLQELVAAQDEAEEEEPHAEDDDAQQARASIEAPGTPAAPSPAATSPSAGSWLADERPMINAGAQDAPMGEDGCVSLVPFAFDAEPIESWRYDACHAARKCAMRRFPQPPGGPNDAAVGMRWRDADQYCATRGLEVQSGPQAYAIWSVLGDNAWPKVVLRRVGPDIVGQGFRCLRMSE